MPAYKLHPNNRNVFKIELYIAGIVDLRLFAACMMLSVGIDSVSEN